MEAKDMDICESNKGADNPEALTESFETTFDASNQLQCNYCSKLGQIFMVNKNVCMRPRHINVRCEIFMQHIFHDKKT